MKFISNQKAEKYVLLHCIYSNNISLQQISYATESCQHTSIVMKDATEFISRSIQFCEDAL